jgi:hypothetical protein
MTLKEAIDHLKLHTKGMTGIKSAFVSTDGTSISINPSEEKLKTMKSEENHIVMIDGKYTESVENG